MSYFYGHGKWWQSHIQSYAVLRRSLRNDGLEQHHLIPRALLMHGPPDTQRLADEVPSISLTQREHQHELHRLNLNPCLAANGFHLGHLTTLSESDLHRAVSVIRMHYERAALSHFAEAVDEFHQRLSDGQNISHSR